MSSHEGRTRTRRRHQRSHGIPECERRDRGGQAPRMRDSREGGGSLVLECDRMHAAAPAEHLRRADDAIDGPVTALDEDVGSHGQDEPQRGVGAERRDEVDGFQRCKHRETIPPRD